VSDTTKKIVAGGAVIAAVALGYLVLGPDESPPKIAPLPPWQESRPQVASLPPMEIQPLTVAGLAFGSGELKLATPGAFVPETAAVGAVHEGASVAVGVSAASELTLASVRLNAASVQAGAAEQALARSGTLQVASVQVKAPGVPGWLDGWFWPSWRGRSPAPPEGVVPVVVWPGSPPAGPHLVAVTAEDATPMKPLAEYLAADAQAMAVIVAWEETDHSFRPDATLDAARAEAVAEVVRAARPGLPVWLLCSLTVTGSPEQAAAKVAAAKPDALMLYGLFARAAWESDKVVAANLEKGRKLLTGKAIYAAGLRLSEAEKQQAVDRAKRLGWGGMVCDGSAR
jgi:hypothetical protein